MTERLEYLDREYLSDYEYMEVDSAIKEQKPFDKMVRIETEYPVNEEDDNNKSYFPIILLWNLQPIKNSVWQ